MEALHNAEVKWQYSSMSLQCLINSCFTQFFWGEIQCSPVSWYVSYRDFAGDAQP